MFSFQVVQYRHTVTLSKTYLYNKLGSFGSDLDGIFNGEA